MRISTITPFGYCTKAHLYVMFSKNEDICMSAELTGSQNSPAQEPGIAEPTTIDTGETIALRLENPATLVELSPVTPAASTPTLDIILTPRQRRALNYLARRRMRHARIIKRQALASRTLTTGTPPAIAIVQGTTAESEPAITTIPTGDAFPLPDISTSEPVPASDATTYTSEDKSRPDNPHTDTPAITIVSSPSLETSSTEIPLEMPIVDTPPTVAIAPHRQPARPTQQERTSILRSLPPMPPLPPRSSNKQLIAHRPEITT